MSSFRPGRDSEQDSATPPQASCGKPYADDQAIFQIDLRVTGIPSDEIFEDEQYMQCITKRIEKLVDTENGQQEEPLENNILSEEAAMQIYEAGICELHEVQPRTVKVQCQRCPAYVEAGFQVCLCGGKLDMTEDMLSRKRGTLSELIENCICLYHFRKIADLNMVFYHFKNIVDEPEK